MVKKRGWTETKECNVTLEMKVNHEHTIGDWGDNRKNFMYFLGAGNTLFLKLGVVAWKNVYLDSNQTVLSNFSVSHFDQKDSYFKG